MCKLLIVDEGLYIRKLLCKIFRDSKFQVLTSKNELQALQTIETNEIDVALLDYHMPELNGIETSKIKQFNAQINVVIIYECTFQQFATYCNKVGSE